MLGVVLLVGALTGCQPATTAAPASRPAFHGTWLADGYPVPDATLTDTRGHDFDLRTSPSRPVVVVLFGYRHCSTHCTTQLDTLAAALDEVADTTAAQIQVLVVSIDPERDTPADLRTWLDRWDTGWIGLRCELAEVQGVAEALGVEIGSRRPVSDGHGSEQTDKPGKGKKTQGDPAEDAYEIAHGAQLVGIDRTRTARLVWVEGTTPAQLADDLTTFVQEQR